MPSVSVELDTTTRYGWMVGRKDADRNDPFKFTLSKFTLFFDQASNSFHLFVVARNESALCLHGASGEVLIIRSGSGSGSITLQEPF